MAAENAKDSKVGTERLAGVTQGGVMKLWSIGLMGRSWDSEN